MTPCFEIIGSCPETDFFSEYEKVNLKECTRSNDELLSRKKMTSDSTAYFVHSLRGSVEFRNVTFSYQKSDSPALQAFSLKVKEGNSVALVGESGCGKSTILSLLAGLYLPESGDILIGDGVPLRDISVIDLQTVFGYVGQEPILFNLSVRENVLLGKLDATDDEVETALRRANAYEFVLNLPGGWDYEVGNFGGRLSGGQKQRISIARALVRAPKILILDEPTSALDPCSEKEVIEAISSLRSSVDYPLTMISVAHRLSTIEKCDDIVVLGEWGKILERGVHTDLLGKKGHYFMMNSNGTVIEKIKDTKKEKLPENRKKSSISSSELKAILKTRDKNMPNLVRGKSAAWSTSKWTDFVEEELQAEVSNSSQTHRRTVTYGCIKLHKAERDDELSASDFREISKASRKTKYRTMFSRVGRRFRDDHYEISFMGGKDSVRMGANKTLSADTNSRYHHYKTTSVVPNALGHHRTASSTVGRNAIHRIDTVTGTGGSTGADSTIRREIYARGGKVRRNSCSSINVEPGFYARQVVNNDSVLYKEEMEEEVDANEVRVEAATSHDNKKVRRGTLNEFLFTFENSGATKWRYVVAAIFSLALGTSGATLAYLTAHSIEDLTSHPKADVFDKVEGKVISFAILTVVYFILFYAIDILILSQEAVAGAILRTKLFAICLSQEVSWFSEDENSPGALSTILTADIQAVGGVLGGTLVVLLVSFGSLVFGLGQALYINPTLTGYCLVSFPVIVLVVMLNVRVSAIFSRKIRVALSAASDIVSETVYNIRTVATLHRHKFFFERYENRIDEWFIIERKGGFVYSLLSALTPFTVLLSVALAFYIGGQMILDGKIDFVDVILIFISVQLATNTVVGFMDALPDISRSKIGSLNINRLLELSPEVIAKGESKTIRGGEGLGEHRDCAIEFQNVFFAYPNNPGKPVLNNVSFTISEGEVVALVGLSGSGKSTIVCLLERFYKPTSGRILIYGKNIESYEINELRDLFGFVGQMPQLIGSTVIDAVLYGESYETKMTYKELGEPSQEEKKTKVEGILDECGMLEFVEERLPNGIYTEISGIVGNKKLSGGQKQRLAISRALIRDPSFVLLDEATSALDNLNEALVYLTLQKFAARRLELLEKSSISSSQVKGKRPLTMVSVSHKLSTVEEF